MKTITIGGKVRDTFWLRTNTGIEYDGYVPDSSLGHDDYLYLEIDNTTGQILNWKPLTEDDIFADDSIDEDAYEIAND